MWRCMIKDFVMMRGALHVASSRRRARTVMKDSRAGGWRMTEA